MLTSEQAGFLSRRIRYEMLSAARTPQQQRILPELIERGFVIMVPFPLITEAGETALAAHEEGV